MARMLMVCAGSLSIDPTMVDAIQKPGGECATHLHLHMRGGGIIEAERANFDEMVAAVEEAKQSRDVESASKYVEELMKSIGSMGGGPPPGCCPVGIAPPTGATPPGGRAAGRRARSRPRR